MVASSPGWNDDAWESPSFAPIDDKGRRIIVLLWQNWLIEKQDFTSTWSLAIRLVSLPENHYTLEITDNSDQKVPLKFSFSHDVSKWEKPYFNTVTLKTPDNEIPAQSLQYMPLLDLAIEELQRLRSVNTRVRDIL